MTPLAAIGAALSAADCLPEVLMVIAEQAQRALRADTITIARLNDPEPRFETLVSLGAKAGPGCFVGAEDSVIIDGLVWGAVGATKAADSPGFDHEDLRVLRQVTTTIAAAVAYTQRVAELEKLARRDPLTGLANRCVLEEKLREVFDRNSTDRQDVALLMGDIDGLKLINDRLGHGAGDEVLVEAGRALSAAAATVSNATVCRVGGDEFCVILDGGGRRHAEPVTTLALRLFSESGPRRSLSWGIAFATPDLTSPGDLLRAADDAQYKQKRRIRDSPRCFTSDGASTIRRPRRAPPRRSPKPK